MTEHPSLEALAVLADGGADDRLRAHVEGCSTCRPRYDLLAALPAQLAALPAPPLPPAVAERLDAIAAATPVPLLRRRRGWAGPLAAWGAAAAVLAGVVAGGALLAGQHATSGSGSATSSGGAQSTARRTTAPAVGAFTRADLPAQVRALVAGSAGGVSPRARSGADALATPVVPVADVPGCLAAAGLPAATPMAAAEGTFDGRDAVLLVVPRNSSRTVVDAAVVGRDCSARRPDVRYTVPGLRLR